ncbi:MAG: precorrin-4 C(11)-methyltransferase [Prevotella sp.]|nr:precorrin-4 C(11)-methyltransferase [Bacteroidaceae bacterium]MBR1505671.1 precorrin-4 C(11)-methyltransferase [Prevotella sp.]
MSQIAIIPIGEAGGKIASVLESKLGAKCIQRSEVSKEWKRQDAFVFIGALGICVRTIAPFIEDKHTDPAVVCIDSSGQHVISVLSGHVGGANDLTRQISDLLNATPVITTQSDNQGLWALDTLDRQFGWSRMGHDNLNAHIFAFVNRKPTALLLEAHDEGTDYLEASKPDHVTLIHDIGEATPERYKLIIVVSPYRRQMPEGMLSLQFVPRVATYGLGLAHQAAPADRILQEIDEAIEAQGLYPCACEYATIDVKRDEAVVKLLQERGERVRFFTAEELSKIPVPHPSPTVESHVGTPSVCEAAAILASEGAPLVVPKQKGKDWTVAVAIPVPRQAHIEIVGAGPGDPDLISVRGRRFLEQADLILYAGSLVPKALTECHKPGAVVRSSADMNLEEQCQLMKEHYERGHLIVRLHTGDPCIFGAIQEQMAFFDREGMSYHITPGISSFLAAAAELRSQFTIPERTQTIILTRGEGRTPMPDKEKLHLLARSQSTMCIFLSASIVDDVQQQLLQHYPADTPMAACYHLTWPDQKIYRGKLKDLAKIVHDNHLTLTTMLVVGEAIDNRRGLSELYNKHFTHLFRKGTGQGEDSEG